MNTVDPELHPILVVSPWYHIGIDFIGPISPPSPSGNKYILTIGEYFTKLVVAFPWETKHAEGFAATLSRYDSYSMNADYFDFTHLPYTAAIYGDGGPSSFDE